jgi:hypothetical protein
MVVKDFTDTTQIPRCPGCGQETRLVSGDSWSCDTCDYGFTPVRSVNDLEMVDDESGVTWIGDASDLGIDARRWPGAIILYGFDDQKATFTLDGTTEESASYAGTYEGEEVNILIEHQAPLFSVGSEPLEETPIAGMTTEEVVAGIEKLMEGKKGKLD